MFILTSNGISSEELFLKTKEYIKENMKSAALITTASTGHKDKDLNVRRHTNILEHFGVSVELVDIAEQNPKLLDKFDVIFLMGGNPFYLLEKMRETNCRELFSSYLKNKVIIGASAGSMVFGTTIGLVYELHPFQNDKVGLTDFTGLSLTDINVYPHVSRYVETVDKFLDRMRDFQNRNRIQFTCLNDGQAVFISENEIVVI